MTTELKQQAHKHLETFCYRKCTGCGWATTEQCDFCKLCPNCCVRRQKEGDYQGECQRCGEPIYELSGDRYAHVGCQSKQQSDRIGTPATVNWDLIQGLAGQVEGYLKTMALWGFEPKRDAVLIMELRKELDKL